MPKKQNGFGSPKGFSFTHKQKPIDKAFGGGSAGYYPSNRRYGSSVHRSVIEHWDLNSTWTMWRKGYEMSIKSAWDEFKVATPADQPGPEYQPAVLNSMLYAGTSYELATKFTGTRFPTSGADSATHYVVKREVDQEVDLGVVSTVYNDPVRDKDHLDHGEIWVQGTPGADALLLRQMIGERLSDGTTEASVTMVLDKDKKPAVFRGKSWIGEGEKLKGDATDVLMQIPLPGIIEYPYSKPERLDQGMRPNTRNEERESILLKPELLIDKIISIPNFFIEREISKATGFLTTAQTSYYYGCSIFDAVPGLEIIGLDPGSQILPPSMYDLSTLDPIFTAEGTAYVTGTYIFSKDEIQRWYGRQDIDGLKIFENAEQLSYSILPFFVKDARIKDNTLFITARPFSSEMKLYPPLDPQGYVVFNDKSFAKTENSCFDMNVDPWQDEVFASGEPLTLALLYACSCPAYSHSILSMPQSDEDEYTRKTNCQRR